MSDRPPRRAAGTLLAAWRRFCYRLTTHHCLAIPLKRWVWLWVALPPLVAWIGRLAWVRAIGLSVLGAAVLIGAEAARRKQYVLFVPAAPSVTAAGPSAAAADPSAAAADSSTWAADSSTWAAHPNAPQAGDPLGVDQPLLCWASGLLGVEGKTRALAGERASVSYVRTREHVVMAQVRRTRFLLLARVPKADVGYWYAFFHPRRVQLVRLGTLFCGFSVRPALELRIAGEKTGQSDQLYLGFEDAGARRRLLDDLRRDVGRGAFVG